ncbi:hypothetical protein BHE74_00023658 [Ensete ventricosum]|nr:hypothetical protein BHE74_00023658 [Ensete ventricosum]RZR79154.1 hypothetical protein BHM03_00004786 [Ensete ventricosum]
MKLTKKWVLHTGQRRQSQTKEGGEAEEEEEVSLPPIKQRLLLKPSCSSPPLGPQSVRMREAVERERERARSFLASSQALDSRVLESRVRVQP